eukprot:1615405-Rhodomonas_salina.4
MYASALAKRHKQSKTEPSTGDDNFPVLKDILISHADQKLAHRVGKLRQAGSVTSRSDIESTLLTANVNLIGARRKGRDEGGGSRVCERVLDVEGLWACAPSRLEAG